MVVRVVLVVVVLGIQLSVLVVLEQLVRVMQVVREQVALKPIRVVLVVVQEELVVLV
jgi:hypothetical protein